jgi:hypothetical protein
MHNRIVGPVAMITVGVLFLLEYFTPYRFHQTWPLLLIAIGGAMALQRSRMLDSATPVSTNSTETSEKR